MFGKRPEFSPGLSAPCLQLHTLTPCLVILFLWSELQRVLLPEPFCPLTSGSNSCHQLCTLCPQLQCPPRRHLSAGVLTCW